MSENRRRRASGLLRTLVVATATVAILLVCFSIYQSTQVGPTGARTRASRFPETTAPPADGNGPVDPAPSGGILVGDAVVGAGRNIRRSLYGKEGKEAIAELAVRDWLPVDGAADRLRLVEPEIRLWTGDDHAVRITAEEGFLEGRSRHGGVDLDRGRLVGNVVIEYDRLTREEREKHPLERRENVDPSETIKLETELIEFDREYAKGVIPGDLRVTGSDVAFRGTDIEIRFDETATRVESLHVRRGGDLELRGATDQFGFDVPRSGAAGSQRLTLTDWMRATLVERIQATAARSEPIAPAAASHSTPKPSPPDEHASGPPRFRLGDEGEEKSAAKPPVRYHARFEGNIEARQVQNGAVLSRLLADGLEVLRDFSEEDRERVRPAAATADPAAAANRTPSGAPADASSTIPESFHLTWSETLAVQAVHPNDPLFAVDARVRVTARGSPVAVSSPDGEALCAVLIHEPDGAKTWLEGDGAAPVRLRSPETGWLSGAAVYSERSETATLVQVAGPGVLTRSAEGLATLETPSPRREEEHPTTWIEFDDQLIAHGRTVRRAILDASWGVTRRDQQIIDRAEIRGRVRLREGDTALTADSMIARFGPPPRWREGRQSIEHLFAAGGVEMTQGTDRLTGREVDVSLGTNGRGDTIPLTAAIVGDVEAVQDERTLRAADRLIVDFDPNERPAEPPTDPTGRTSSATVKRLRAYGDVAVHDPRQRLDLTARELDAEIAGGRDIETAEIIGTEEHPAFVHLDTFSVTGSKVLLNVRDDWADVPGAGRMTFHSFRDLDGRRTDQPIPIAVAWKESMKYRGRENLALFTGGVHAASETTTTFDCEQFHVEFEDAPPSPPKPTADWWVFQGLVDQWRARDEGEPTASETFKRRFHKEPSVLVAVGQAVAVTSEFDETTGDLRGRARLSGPRLSVHLRKEVSKMLIEGAGSLLLEDFRPPPPTTEAPKESKSLFAVAAEGGLSKTLIDWKETMWYDFSIDQTRFLGDVEVKHFSGQALERITDISRWNPATLPPGRSTFLKAEELTIDFLPRSDRAKRREESRMGRLSAESLDRFRAAGAVVLQDQQPSLSVALTAEEIVYEKQRDLLDVHGAPRQQARIITQKPGEYPRESMFRHFFYNLATGRVEVADVFFTGP